MSIEVRSQREADRERVVALHAQAFRVPEYRLVRQRNLALDEGWVITEGNAVVGGLRAENLGQFFGGKSLGSSIITAVKIAPEARGRGLGHRLMVEVLAALRERGIPLSTLYPSSPGLYRRVGYEIAASWTRYRVAPGDLPRAHGEIVEWRGDVTPEILSCYRAFGRVNNGLVDRSTGWWRERIVDPYLDRPTFRYVARKAGEVTGYVVFGQEPDPHAVMPYSSAVNCLDLVWGDAAAAGALLAFLGAQGPLVSAILWSGPPNDPLGVALNAAPLRVAETMPSMLRLIDVEKALAGRGYPDGPTVEVTFGVRDPSLPANNGAYHLVVEDGAASVTPVASAACTIDVRGLAAMYSGYLSAAAVARLGLIDGPAAEVLDPLDRAFAGPPPWMVELV